jgi:hypothetical protein
LAERHASTAQGVRLNRIDCGRRFSPREPNVNRAEQEATEHRRAKRCERRDTLSGAEPNVERNAVNPHMRGVDDAGHHRNA